MQKPERKDANERHYVIRWLVREVKKLINVKGRLEQDENAWLKVQESANRQHAESLNQLGDLFKMVARQQEQIDHLKKRLDVVEGGVK